MRTFKGIGGGVLRRIPHRGYGIAERRSLRLRQERFLVAGYVFYVTLTVVCVAL